MPYTYKQCIEDAIGFLRTGRARYACDAIVFACHRADSLGDYGCVSAFIKQFHQDCQVRTRGASSAWLGVMRDDVATAWRIEVLTLIHTEQYALLHEKLREHFANNPSPYYLGGNNYDE